MNTKSNRIITHGLIPKRQRKDLTSDDPWFVMPRKLTVRALFTQKRRRKLLDRFQIFRCENGLLHHKLEILQGVAR